MYYYIRRSEVHLSKQIIPDELIYAVSAYMYCIMHWLSQSICLDLVYFHADVIRISQTDLNSCGVVT